MSEESLLDIGYLSINKKGEELCGDHVEILRPNLSETTSVLADGLGSGVQANILSTLTASMLSRMIEGGLSLDESVDSVIKTLPLAKNRGNVAYSTFTIMKVDKDFMATLINYDNPEPILLKNGVITPIPFTYRLIAGKKIASASFPLEISDAVVMCSDGAVYAGVGESLNFGWTRKEIASYMSALYDDSISSKSLATLLVDHCNVLYNSRPGDDTTSLVVRRRKALKVNYMVGPATSEKDDEMMMKDFFVKADRHLVSGGTSGKVVSSYLHEPITGGLDYVDKGIPPISHLRGIDLLTEGVITLNRLVELAKDHLGPNHEYFNWSYRQDGASLLAKELFEEASDVSFYVGCAVNPAHQDPRLHINISIKMQLVESLTAYLKQMGKSVQVKYF